VSMTVRDLLRQIRDLAEAGQITLDTPVVTAGDDEGWCCAPAGDLSPERAVPMVADAETRTGHLLRLLSIDDSDPRESHCAVLWPEVRR
jgi:hypothetical protein